MSESFAELFEESFQKQQNIRQGMIISATVVDVLNDMVIVSAGLKSEAYIPITQFRDDRGGIEVNTGDEVEVVLDALDDGYGETRLSREKAKRLQAWGRLEEAHNEEQVVSGMITDRIKGGFTVDISGLRAFLPGSLIDQRAIRDVSQLEGKPMDLKVIKIDRQRKNIVVSRRAVTESQNAKDQEELLESIKEGAVLKGVVKNLTEYGAFIDLGGVDGLLHVTDMAWKRVKDPAELLDIGEEIEVKVLKFDRERNRVSLGLKQMGEDPWLDLVRRYPEKTRLFGKVTNLVDYGCFVEIEEGVEGLVHVSEMDWVSRNLQPSKKVQIGEEVEVMVLGIDETRRRISLGIKQCHPNPWQEFAEKYSRNDRVRGVVKSIMDFGIFVGLPEGIDGLVHATDIAWQDGDEVIHEYKKGQELEAVILSVDANRERISLGIKQMQKDPFSTYIADNSKGSVVKAVVEELGDKALFVSLAEGVSAQLKYSELFLDEDAEQARAKVKQGDELDVKIIAVDRKKRNIGVSVKARLLEEEQRAAREYAPDAAEAKTRLGDILKSGTEEDS